ncbi:MAG: OmpA family protein [Deltaproteobacteria bacterium]|nr:OmpA family protein [Deltaproteobacteria bacterium]
MKKIYVFLMIIALAMIGCAQPQNKTQKGALYGAGIGAAGGAVVGQAIGRDTKSTLIGAGLGALAGGLAGGGIGRMMDQQEEAMRVQLANVENANIQRNANMLAVTFKSEAWFDVDSATLKPGGYNELQRVATVLNQYPQTTIQVAGHTDSTGSEEYNRALSVRRAEAAKSALVGFNVNPARMTTIGYGESQPVADNSTPEGRQMNRRVQITIVPMT